MRNYPKKLSAPVVETMPKLGYLDIRNCSIKDSSVVKRLKKKGGIKIEQ